LQASPITRPPTQQAELWRRNALKPARHECAAALPCRSTRHRQRVLTPRQAL
jgi:hypothetical protein